MYKVYCTQAIRSMAVVLLLFIHHCCCYICLLEFGVRYLFCFVVLCVVSSFAIVSLGKKELVALLLLRSMCHVSVIVL